MVNNSILTEYGQMDSNHHKSLLKDVCLPDGGIQTGPFGSQLHQDDYVSEGIPIITVENLGDNRIVTDDVPKVSECDYIRLQRYSLKKGDVVFSRVGSVDRRALVTEREDGWLFSGRCIRVRPDPSKIDSGYLSWFFGLSGFKDYVRKIAFGATMPSLNTNLMEMLPIYYPSLEEQHAIAHILGTLDDKIELNRQMNETLEAIARAIFKSWFIDFDPVRAKMEGRKPFGMDEETAALFPDSFEDSELGEIPKGWNIQRLDSLLELTYGKPGDYNDDESRGVPVYGSNGQIGWTGEPLVKGPGIIVGRKGSSGIVTWSHSDFFPIDTTFYVNSKIGNEEMRYLYHVLMSLNLPDLTINAGVPGLNRNDAHSQQVVIPSQEIIKAFCSFISPFIERIASNEKESRILSLIRDTLLPKLISGEIRIPPFGEQIGE